MAPPLVASDARGRRCIQIMLLQVLQRERERSSIALRPIVILSPLPFCGPITALSDYRLCRHDKHLDADNYLQTRMITSNSMDPARPDPWRLPFFQCDYSTKANAKPGQRNGTAKQRGSGLEGAPPLGPSRRLGRSSPTPLQNAPGPPPCPVP